MLPTKRLIDLANRLPALFRLDLIRGRVEAIEMIFDLIDNITNNFLLEMHRVNDELMVNCESCYQAPPPTPEVRLKTVIVQVQK